MYMLIRRYEGVQARDVDEVMRRVDEGFAPILEETPGFRGYWAIDGQDGVLASVTLFDDRAGGDESNRRAAAFVRENLAALVPNPPQVTQGEANVARHHLQAGTPVRSG
jgi:hypothetical protein